MVRLHIILESVDEFDSGGITIFCLISFLNIFVRESLHYSWYYRYYYYSITIIVTIVTSFRGCYQTTSPKMDLNTPGTHAGQRKLGLSSQKKTKTVNFWPCDWLTF